MHFFSLFLSFFLWNFCSKAIILKSGSFLKIDLSPQMFIIFFELFNMFFTTGNLIQIKQFQSSQFLLSKQFSINCGFDCPLVLLNPRVLNQLMGSYAFIFVAEYFFKHIDKILIFVPVRRDRYVVVKFLDFLL